MNVQELHKTAIEIVDQAFLKKFYHDESEATILFNNALKFETEAAFLARSLQLGEPTESVLFRSAASIALNAKNLEQAEKLTAQGLVGDPPHEIAEELRNLLEDIYFQRHLSINGITLNDEEFQMVIAGQSVGYGYARTEQVLDRLSIFEKLTFRTVERKLGKPFRERGQFSKEILNMYQSYLSVPRAASLAFTIRLGKSIKQMELFGGPAMQVIDDILDNLELVNNANDEKLAEKITDKTYLKNFIMLSKELAPDGKEISLVGFTVIRNGKERKVEFTKPKNEFNLYAFEEQSTIELNEPIVEVSGRLSAADSSNGKIKLTPIDNRKYSIIVPEGLGDIVKKYWDENVTVKGYQQKGRTIKLIDLNSSE